jgi:microsomal dipeptidase-like Zn-dependent dipeptidase
LRKSAVLGAAILVLLAAGFALGPRVLESRMNGTLRPGPYTVSERARALHGRLFVADLHADSLLWGRDLLARGTRGHVDVPRLLEGGVALQAFTIVSKTPRGINIERNDDKSDQITLVALLNRWPRATWTSLRERALHQARRLDAMARRSAGRLVVLRTRGDLEAYLRRREEGIGAGGGPAAGVTAGLLGIEGAQVLEGRLANVDVLADAGFRMMAPTHFFDNEVGGSAHGIEKGGLTPLGREVVKRMEQLGMLVDLAHGSPRTIADVLAMATRPVVVSHTGVKGTCDNRRNLSDPELRGVARTGGVVGIGYWDAAVCGTDVEAVARAIRHAVAVAGADHVGLGSDFDGAVTTPFDTTGLPLVTQALLDAGLSEDDVSKVMGGNVRRVLLAVLRP